MIFINGETFKDDDYVALYPQRIEKHENYELWQHPYYLNNCFYNDPDLQLIYFNSDGSIDSYHISCDKVRFKDKIHLARLQLIYHDITLNFNEYTYLVDDIYSDQTNFYIQSIINEKNNS